MSYNELQALKEREKKTTLLGVVKEKLMVKPSFHKP